MGSKVISFRVSRDLYEKFERKCREEEVSPTVMLNDFVESLCHSTKVEKVMVTDLKKKSWFPLDFSPLFGRDR
jgi:hypothetical protein